MVKKKKSDGTFYYYYYKKRRGRHKKRGRKPKEIEKEKKAYVYPWSFKIVRFVFKKENEFIGRYRNLQEANEAKQMLLEKNKTVEFPVQYINNRRKNDGISEYEDEYVLLKRITEENENNESMIRNEYGKLVKHVITKGKYYVFDKFPCCREETFLVYGYDAKEDRKTYNWIYTNLIDLVLDNDAYTMINVFIYGNKVIFRYGSEDFEFVLCKNPSDAIRMYNKLREKYKKYVQVVFTGSVSGHSEKGNEIIELIRKRTGWDYNKIYKSTTFK